MHGPHTPRGASRVLGRLAERRGAAPGAADPADLAERLGVAPHSHGTTLE